MKMPHIDHDFFDDVDVLAVMKDLWATLGLVLAAIKCLDPKRALTPEAYYRLIVKFQRLGVGAFGPAFISPTIRVVCSCVCRLISESAHLGNV
jgi:hypothetical protein